MNNDSGLLPMDLRERSASSVNHLRPSMIVFRPTFQFQIARSSLHICCCPSHPFIPSRLFPGLSLYVCAFAYVLLLPALCSLSPLPAEVLIVVPAATSSPRNPLFLLEVTCLSLGCWWHFIWWKGQSCAALYILTFPPLLDLDFWKAGTSSYSHFSSPQGLVQELTISLREGVGLEEVGQWKNEGAERKWSSSRIISTLDAPRISLKK